MAYVSNVVMMEYLFAAGLHRVPPAMHYVPMLGKYLKLWIMRAAENSVMLTDKLTILIVPFSTLVLWMTGTKMTNTIQETLALGVAITVIGVVILRLLAASYMLWRDDQKEKAELQKIIDAPSRAVEASLKSYTADRRKLLSEKLSRLTAMAGYRSVDLSSKFGVSPDELHQLLLEIDALIDQLSYDVPLRIAAIRMKEYCIKLMGNAAEDKGRLWAQRKITFQILHKDDRISDLMSLIDIEIITEEDYPDLKDQADIVVQLKEMVKKLGDHYYSSDVTSALKKSFDRP